MKTGTRSRDLRLDAIRGLLLVVMAAVHVPTPLSNAFHEPVGFVGTAEGFFFLSAVLSGIAYGRTLWQADWLTMAQRAWRRARRIYWVHLGVVVPVALIAWLAAGRVIPLANHFHEFLQHPWGSLLLVPLLLNQPPLFDILPLYVVLLLATPLILAWGRHFGWGKVLGVSGSLWLVAQSSLSASLFGDTSRWLPLCWSSFNLPAWQFLWVGGLAVGESAVWGPLIKSNWRRGLGGVATVIVAAGFLSRHGWWPQGWSPPELVLWVDKWTLGPLRLLNFAAWTVLLLAWNPRPAGWVLAPLALLGRNSLGVFAFHIPLAIAATTVIQMNALSNASQIVVGILVIAALFPWANWLERDRRNSAGTVSAPALAAGMESPAESGYLFGPGWRVFKANLVEFVLFIGQCLVSMPDRRGEEQSVAGSESR